MAHDRGAWRRQKPIPKFPGTAHPVVHLSQWRCDGRVARAQCSSEAGDRDHVAAAGELRRQRDPLRERIAAAVTVNEKHKREALALRQDGRAGWRPVQAWVVDPHGRIGVVLEPVEDGA